MPLPDDREIRSRAERWRAGMLQAQLEAMGERKERFETDSGIPVKSLYTPLDSTERDYLESLGFPGEFPFTRGADPNMYRSQSEIAQSAFAYERDLEEKRKITVGMNLHGDPVAEDDHHACYQLDPALQAEQIRQLGEFKRRRDPIRLTAALAAVRETAGRPEGNENNLMAPIKEAVKSHATIGEIVRALKDVFGEHREG